jgi:hypothetical protein
MVTNRSPLTRQRNPMIDEEVLALFVSIERGPPSGRKPYSEPSRELARKLDLIDLWWMGCTPCDDSLEPCHPPWCSAHEGWHRCRRIREELLALAVERGLMTAANPAPSSRKPSSTSRRREAQPRPN